MSSDYYTYSNEDNSSESFEHYIKLLNDQNPNNRLRAAENLGDLGDVKAVEPLLSALKDEASTVRVAALLALGKLKDKRAIDPILNLLLDKDAEVRAIAVSTLSEFQDNSVVKPLINVLKDKNPSVCYEAITTLGNLKDVRAIEPLIDNFDNNSWPLDISADLTDAAVWALTKIGEPAVLPLINAMRSKSIAKRLWAINTLGEIGDPRAVEPLAAALTENDETVCYTVVEALEKIGDVKALPALEILKKDDKGMIFMGQRLKDLAAQAIAAIMCNS